MVAVHRADENAEYGLGGPHGADLYLELAPGYYLSSEAGTGPLAEAASPMLTGVHGRPPFNDALMQGFAVLGGDGFADGGVVERAMTTDLAPTAAAAVGLEPPADATGQVRQGWLAEGSR